LALYRCEKTGTEIAGAVNRNGYGLAILGEDVVTAVDAID